MGFWTATVSDDQDKSGMRAMRVQQQLSGVEHAVTEPTELELSPISQWQAVHVANRSRHVISFHRPCPMVAAKAG
jgi:hypothetical protein